MRCGYRAAEDGDCRGCRRGPLIDIREDSARELIDRWERERIARRQTTLLWTSIAIAMVAGVYANAFVPLYQEFRRGIALPLFIDQLMIMAALAFGISLLLVRVFRVKPRFPELATAGTSPSRAPASP
jgi:hypothetical protein